MTSCMWATVYLSKDNEEFKCAIQNVEVRNREAIFETVQALSAISNIVIVKSTDLKEQWIGEVVIGEIIRSWIRRLLHNSHQNVCIQWFGSVSWRNMSRTS